MNGIIISQLDGERKIKVYEQFESIKIREILGLVWV